MFAKIKVALSLIGLTIMGIMFAKAKADAKQAKLTLKYNKAEEKMKKVIDKKKALEVEGEKLRKDFLNAKSNYRNNLRNRTKGDGGDVS